MSDTEAPLPALARIAQLHGKAALVQASPLIVRTRDRAWAYAVSVPLEGPEATDFVVEARLRVIGGTVAVSCTNEARDALVGEQFVRESGEPVRLELLADPAHASYLLIRTGPKPRSAMVEIHEVSCRAFSEAERLAIAAIPTLQPMPGWSRFYGTDGDTIVERARVRRYLGLTGPLRWPWLDGLTVMIVPDDQLSRALFVSGLYEPSTAVLLQRLLAPGAIFLDVGAHAGIFTLLASRLVGDGGRVVSFEPSDRERARLEEHVAINELQNVTIVAAAVADREGEGTLQVATARYGGLNTLGHRFAYEGVDRVAVVSVPVITLDRFAAREHLDRVDVIKLDIEGAECAALRGAAALIRACRPVLIIEVVSAALVANGSTREQLEQVLRELGYDLFRIDEATADLVPLPGLAEIDEQNVVALPAGSGLRPLNG